MFISILKSKIHRARVTDARTDYIGSITIDRALMDAAGIREYEKVLVADVNNGARLETYAICGERGSGEICLNGAAANLCSIGDIVIIMSFALVENDEADGFKPTVVFVDEKNRLK